MCSSCEHIGSIRRGYFKSLSLLSWSNTPCLFMAVDHGGMLITEFQADFVFYYLLLLILLERKSYSEWMNKQ